MTIFKHLQNLFFLAILTIQACNIIPLKEGILKNERIPVSKRDNFHRLTDSLFSDIKANNFDAVESMLSASLLENNYNKRTRELIGNHLRIEKYSLYSDYYMVNRALGKEFISPGASRDLHYQPIAKEMYLSFYLPKKSSNQHMITIVYGKFDYGWKIDKIEFEPYTKNGKTAAQLFEQAKKQYAKGYLVDAINTMAWAQDCAQPSEELVYPDDNDMRAFHNRAINEANKKYKFPTVMGSVTGHPAIFRVLTRDINDGTYPVISYLSAISLKDTTALKVQNNEVKKIIGSIIPGINKDKRYLTYNIYNEKPNAKTNSYSFTIVDKLQ